MKVCFSCTTSYQIFISFMLSITKYKNYNKTIIISDEAEANNKIYNNILKTSIWNTVKLIRIKNIRDADIEEQINKINIEDIDILHIFHLVPIMNKILMRDLSSLAKVILTDEGAALYNLKDNLSYWGKIVDVNSKLKINIDRVDEICFLDKVCYDNSINKKVTEIDVEEFYCELHKNNNLNIMNKIFEYNEEVDFKVVFFDQYFSQSGYLTLGFEEFVRQYLIDNYDELYIKNHPSYCIRNDKYINKYLKNKYTPWEVIMFNDIIKNKKRDFLLISYYSTALFNSLLISKKMNYEVHVVFMYDIIKDYFIEDVGISEEIFKRFKNIYGDLVCIPKSFEEMKNFINSIIPINNNKNCDDDFVKKWLIEEYKKNAKHKSNLNLTDIYYNKSVNYDIIVKLLNTENIQNVINWFKQKKYNNIVIFGCGVIGEVLYDILNSHNINVISFIDNSKYNSLFRAKIKIVNTEQFLLLKNIDVIVVTPIFSFEYIKSQLIYNGVGCEINSIEEIVNNF